MNSSDSWTQLGGVITLAGTPGTVGMGATNLSSGNPIGCNGVAARYARLEVVTNYGDANYVGLSEIRFYYQLPPPNPVRNWSMFE